MAKFKNFLVLKRSENTRELMKEPNAFTLLSHIALRAKRNGSLNIHNLQIGEALLGDYRNYGMSEREYRTAKDKLQNWGIATFKGTNRGTVAKLTDSSIYDINIEDIDKQDDNPETNKRRTGDEQETTNEEDKETIREAKKEKGRFKKPTAQQVTKYARSIGLQLDGQYFINSYEAKHWMIGRSKMRDWRATIRTWKYRSVKDDDRNFKISGSSRADNTGYPDGVR